jgi:hypothetical protein
MRGPPAGPRVVNNYRDSKPLRHVTENHRIGAIAVWHSRD